jgi:large subunit ribosomal protein L20
MAQEQIIQSLNYSYISRRLKKRIFRKYWIYKINSFLRIKKKNYSIFIGLLKKSLIFLNRKILSYLTFFDPIAIDLLYKTIVMKC